MTSLPERVQQAWANRDGPAILATVSLEGMPNIVYVASVSIFSNARFVIADNYFEKTRKNLKATGKGALLFLTKERQSFQIKGTFECHTSGPIFAQMKAANLPKHPGHAAVALCVQEVYSGAERIL
jgi:predicted pyridoxine 5'-phosphate oxidase superfamily flavin-nucleotide-binding protein